MSIEIEHKQNKPKQQLSQPEDEFNVGKNEVRTSTVKYP